MIYRLQDSASLAPSSAAEIGGFLNKRYSGVHEVQRVLSKERRKTLKVVCRSRGLLPSFWTDVGSKTISRTGDVLLY